MSLPSIPEIVKEMPSASHEEILVEAMRRDLPLAVDFLHQQTHRPEDEVWLQDPGSPIGKQLIRLHASDALRPLAEKHFCHGKTLTFINCCGGKLKGKGRPTLAELMDLQIKMQDGVIARADC